MALFNRKPLNQVPQTRAFVLGGTDSITVPNGNYNALTFDFEGTVTAAAGADANFGVLEVPAHILIRSEKYGQLSILSGVQLYYLSLQYGSTPPIVNCGADGGLQSFTATIPVWVEADDTVTVDITWVGAYATFHSTATATTTTCYLMPDYIPSFPMGVLYHRDQVIPANGVIGAAAQLVMTPTIVPGALLTQFMLITSTTAKGTLTDAVESYQLEHNKAFYIGQPVRARILRYTDARENNFEHTAGIDNCKFLPFENQAGTVFTITNGAVATVTGTYLLWCYASKEMFENILRKDTGGYGNYMVVGDWKNKASDKGTLNPLSTSGTREPSVSNPV